MADKKIIVESGSKVTIEINRRKKPQKPSAGDSAPKGLILPRKENDYLPRRNNPIYLNFWDLGQININTAENPIWVDYDYSQIPTLYVALASPGPGVEISFDPLDWGQYEEELFGVERAGAGWKSKFRKFDFETAERYGVDVLIGEKTFPVARAGSRAKMLGGAIDETTWEENKGLKVERANSFKIQSGGAFYTFDTASPDIKITDEPLYSSPEVKFKLDRSCDIFLTPHFGFWMGDANLQYGVSGEGNYYLQNFLDYIYRPWSREKFLDNPDWEDYFGTFVFASYDPIFGIPSGLKADLKTYLQTMSDARLLFTKTNDSPPAIIDNLYIDPDDFPSLPNPDDAEPLPTAGITGQSSAAGMLICVIKKGNKFYFFWAKNSGIPNTLSWTAFLS